ncbi:MAG: metallopeptidase TldD-related protein [bacterium JZ-2024 1]
MHRRLTEGLEHLRSRVARLGAEVWEVYGERLITRIAYSSSEDHTRIDRASFKRQTVPDHLIQQPPSLEATWGEEGIERTQLGWAVRLKKAGHLIFAGSENETEILEYLEVATRAPADFPEIPWEAPAVVDPHHQPITPDPRWSEEPVWIRLKVLHEIGVLPALRYEERLRERVLMNSRGLIAHDLATFFEVWSTRKPISLQRSFSTLLHDLLTQYDRVLRARASRTLTENVSRAHPTLWMLSPETSLELLAGLACAAIRRGSLPSAVSPEIDLLDDGVLPGGYGTESFDGNGGITSRVIIYQDGHPPSPRSLVDETFGVGEARSDAHQETPRGVLWPHWMRSSFRHRPLPGPMNLIIPPGDLQMEEVLAGLPDAFLVERLEMSVSSRGDRVSMIGHGKRMISGEPRETAIMGLEGVAVADLWQRLSARCSEFAVVGRWGSPALLLDIRKTGDD